MCRFFFSLTPGQLYLALFLALLQKLLSKYPSLRKLQVYSIYWKLWKKNGANSCYKGDITKKYNSSRMTGAETDILLLTEGTSTTHGVTIKEKLYKNFLVAHVSVNRSYRILP